MGFEVSYDGVGYFAASVIAFVSAQSIKYYLQRRSVPKKKARRKGVNWGQAFSSGRMPSSHTATVTAFASSIFFVEGFSKLFAVAAVFAYVTVYDSLVSRRSTGEQGAALLKLLKRSPRGKDPLPYVAFGHKPLEVIAGGGLGLLIGLLVAIFIT